MKIPRLFEKPSGAWFIVIVFATTFAVIAILKGLLIYNIFGSSAYDLGIFDQAFWRYSQLLDNFNTVRGLPILGDHFSPIAFVYAPLYWLEPSVGWPIALQTLSVALGSLAFFHITRFYLPSSPYIAAAIAVTYLITPVVHNTLLWEYHDMVLASGLYAALIWAYLKNRPGWFAVLVLLLLSCREDMPFTVFAFGLVALLDRRWRYGIPTVALAAAWWFIVVTQAMPAINGTGYFRHIHGPLSTLYANIGNPSFYWLRLQDPQSLAYVWQVFFPVGLVALFSPRLLLPALPTLVANVLIGGYNTQPGYHYSVNIMPFIFWGAIASIGRLQHGRAGNAGKPIVGALAVALLTLSVWMYRQHSVLNLQLIPTQLADWRANQGKRDTITRIKLSIRDQGVAASDYLVPHLSHREHIYLFPNPWINHYWGIEGERPHHPNQVQFIVVEREFLKLHSDLFEYLVDNGIFEITELENNIVTLRRLRPEADNRDQAVNDAKRYQRLSGLPFHDVAMSPQFQSTPGSLDRLDSDINAQQSVPEGWEPISLAGRDSLDLDLTEGGVGLVANRYVRAVIHSNKPEPVTLLIGSDDGITVWHNGTQIHHVLAARSARRWNDRVQIKLDAGENVFLFRVNNEGGAWRLLASVRPQHSLLFEQMGVRH